MFLIYLFKLSSVIQTNIMNDSKEAGVSGVLLSEEGPGQPSY